MLPTHRDATVEKTDPVWEGRKHHESCKRNYWRTGRRIIISQVHSVESYLVLVPATRTLSDSFVLQPGGNIIEACHFAAPRYILVFWSRLVVYGNSQLSESSSVAISCLGAVLYFHVALIPLLQLLALPYIVASIHDSIFWLR